MSEIEQIRFCESRIEIEERFYCHLIFLSFV